MGDVELAATAPKFLPAPFAWHPDTKEAYRAYQNSEAAKALRAEDIYAVKRLFGYLSMIANLTDELEDAEGDARSRVQTIRTLEEMVQKLATSLGLGPRARQSLGIKTETRPGSRLEAFRRNET